MPTYAIGDVQGCHSELLDLLDHINFDANRDRLWFTGDLVNRGPQSLACLRFVKQLGDTAITILGNHDLHLLAIAAGKMTPRKHDTIYDVLAAEDKTELLDWLRRRPLLHYDGESGFLLVHAGLPPQWDLALAQDCAAEVERELRGEKATQFFESMYGNHPDLWSPDLDGMGRLRFITNCLTRIRYCDRDGRLDLADKGPPGGQAPHLIPWFTMKERRTRHVPVLFGHWASLPFGNLTDFTPFNVYPLDTGCVWGRRLTAMRLEDRKTFSVPSRQKQAGEI
jgi:bis(5'-nucleosyl)-tetraphosphatase (symmetrical)